MKFNMLFVYVIIFLFIPFINAQDSVKTYQLQAIEIIERKNIQPSDKFGYGTNYESSLFDKNGFTLIRRGDNFTQDIYVEGFKRNDIKVVIDGEQYNCACPNRMDVAAARVNPLEMDYVDLSKSGSLLNSGISGKIEYHRSQITEDVKVKSFAQINSGYQNNFDLGASLNMISSNLVLRFAQGTPYKNADSKSFTDLYSYKENKKFTYANAGFRNKLGNVEAGVNFSFSENISFPYLQMDEKHSKIYSAFVSLKGNKLYFNYTDHLMNNNLRKSNMFMETSAKNITIGLTGKFYEATFRNWKADNVIAMGSNSINNDQMPNINQFGLIGAYLIESLPVKLVFKGGVQYLTIGEENRMSFFNKIYPDADKNNFYITAGLNALYSLQFSNDFITSFSADVSTDAPETEQLYIAIERLGTNPDWSGNPTLNQPLKVALRTTFNYSFLTLEGFANYVYNYVNIVKIKSLSKMAMTYENINAAIIGINFNAEIKFIGVDLSYLYGENITDSKPLSEIAPFSITSTFNLPIIYGLKISFVHRYENSMKRIDNSVSETQSSAWNTISLNSSTNIGDFTFGLEIDNLLNFNFSRHLSYVRNPFSSGVKVYDPGRSVRLTVYYDKIF